MAKAIARTLEAAGHPVRLMRVKDALKTQAEGDTLFVGSPTRIGTMTGRTWKLLKNMDVGPWRGKPVVAFDTEAQELLKGSGGGAAARIHDLAVSRGLTVHTPVLRVGVSGIKGPLSTGSEGLVEAYVKEFLRSA